MATGQWPIGWSFNTACIQRLGNSGKSAGTRINQRRFTGRLGSCVLWILCAVDLVCGEREMRWLVPNQRCAATSKADSLKKGPELPEVRLGLLKKIENRI